MKYLALATLTLLTSCTVVPHRPFVAAGQAYRESVTVTMEAFDECPMTYVD